MKFVYIAGPFRGKDPWTVEHNVRECEKHILPIAKKGHIPVCVHSMYRYFDGTLTDEVWLHITEEILTRCDVLLLSDGWQQSAGSQAEKAMAENLGLQIIESIDELSGA